MAQEKSLTPLLTVKGQWDVCTPETVKEFTAVGYFFGRDLHKARRVPVGLIHSSWGGTPAEAWTSPAGLRQLPDFADTPEQIKTLLADPEGAKRQYEARLETWFVANDSGSAPGRTWSAGVVDIASWKTMEVPGLWEEAGEPDLNGVVWLRKSFDLPASAANAAADLQLGMVDDVDTTWVNGVKVGATAGYNLVRKYSVPAGVLKAGRNVVAVRVLDTGGGGGIWGDKKPQLVVGGKPIDLSGPWRYRIGMNLEGAPAPPRSTTGDSGTPTVLYNGMIAPLLPYAVRGVIWYQGESNVHREQQYRALFPAMIADWRQALGPGAPVPVRPDRAPPRHDARAARRPAVGLAAHAEDGDGRDDRRRRRDRHPSRRASSRSARAWPWRRGRWPTANGSNTRGRCSTG